MKDYLMLFNTRLENVVDYELVRIYFDFYCDLPDGIKEWPDRNGDWVGNYADIHQLINFIEAVEVLDIKPTFVTDKLSTKIVHSKFEQDPIGRKLQRIESYDRLNTMYYAALAYIGWVLELERKVAKQQVFTQLVSNAVCSINELSDFWTDNDIEFEALPQFPLTESFEEFALNFNNWYLALKGEII